MKKLFTLFILFSISTLMFAQDHIVETVGSTGFNPTNLTVFAGQTVEFRNTGGTHNVNGTTATYPNNPASFGNGPASSMAWTYQYTFDTPGFYDYRCDPHVGLGMVGTVTVLNPMYPIGLVTADSDMNGIADSVDVEATLVGTVYGGDFDGNNGISFTIIDNAGDGIAVFNFNDVSDYVVTEGDEVMVMGRISNFNGLAQIFADSIIVNSSGNTLAAPLDVTVLDESTESQLVRLVGVTLVDASQWDNSGSNNIDVTDGTNTYTVRLDSDIDLNDEPAPSGPFNITGLGGQFDNSDPFDGGYQLLPRYVADLELIVPDGFFPIGVVTADSDMNGIADSVDVDATLIGTVYGGDFDGNDGISFTIIDNAGDGIAVFNFNDVSDYVVTEGDEVTVMGTISNFNGLAQIFADSILVNSSGNTLMPANTVTTLDESTESQLVRMLNMTLVDATQWDNMGSNNIEITDGTNTFTMRLDSDIDLNDQPAPTGAFNITGLGGQFDNSDPFDGGYQILPRYIADLEEITLVDSDLIISGLADPQGANGSGGTAFGPRTVELYALADIADLSVYGIGSANNGGGTDGVEFTFPAIAISAGSCITLADSADVDRYMTFFGVMPTILVPGSVTGINGDDAMELFKDTVVVDVFGDINVDGSGQTWEYTDGWAYRKAATGPDGATFVESNWIFSGVDALQSDMDSVNTAFANPFPLCSYSPNPPAVIAAMDDSAVIEFDMADVLDILANDDIPNTLVSITITTMAANGAVVVNGLTDVTYTPTTGFCGTDSFVYEICDAASCSSATVNITVTCPINYVPYDIGLVTADSDGNGVGDSLGVAVELTGVVYGVDLQSNDNIQFFIIDGNNDGISLFSSNNFGYTVTEGDEVTVKGFISQFNGLTQIAPDELVVNSSANTLVTPTDVTSLGEDTESQLVRLLNVTLVDPWPTAPAPAGFNVNVTDGTNTYTIRIDDAVELYSMPAPVGVLNITGLGGQFDSSDPWTEGYQLLPRYAADIEEVVATVNPDLGNKIKMFPNPVNEVLQINAEIQLDNIRITNLLGQQVTEIRQPNLSESINVNNWQSGIYVITFMTGDEIWTSQFVKK